MGMKPPMNESQTPIRNVSNSPKHRDNRAPVKNMSVPESGTDSTTMEQPPKNSVNKKRRGL